MFPRNSSYHVTIFINIHLFPTASDQCDKTFQQVSMKVSLILVGKFCYFGQKQLGKGVMLT